MDPIYNDTIYVLPRKMGIDHIPSHTHRPIQGEGGITQDFDRFRGVQPVGDPLQNSNQDWDKNLVMVELLQLQHMVGVEELHHVHIIFCVIKKILYGMIPMMVDFQHPF